jgi:hypothetical protein
MVVVAMGPVVLEEEVKDTEHWEKVEEKTVQGKAEAVLEEEVKDTEALEKEEEETVEEDYEGESVEDKQEVKVEVLVMVVSWVVQAALVKMVEVDLD